MKIAVISCYSQIDYVRTRSLRAALRAVDDVEVIELKNSHSGFWRYIEVPIKIIRAHFKDKPDVYLITFRGYEMLLFMVLTLVRRPIIFDELVNFTEWMEEHQHIKQNTWVYDSFRAIYGSLARHAQVILADTPAHAAYSAELNRMSLENYYVIPVGTDETVFYPRPMETEPGKFVVFYYVSKMLPLHGMDYVLEAALMLKDNDNISFSILGGGEKAEWLCSKAAGKGAHVSHNLWIPFEELPAVIAEANLTIGGPLGNTLQSRFVITNKTTQCLSLGVPVLIGRNEVNSLFIDKKNSLVVDQADAKAIVESIEWAHKHPKQLKAIGEAGRKLYEEHFSQDIINGLVKDLVRVVADN